MGMLPKNNLRKDLVKKYVTIYTGPYHNIDVLPQFQEPIPKDINDETNLSFADREGLYISYHSGKTIPEEFNDLPIDLDETIDVPVYARKKTHTEPRYNLKLAYAAK